MILCDKNGVLKAKFDNIATSIILNGGSNTVSADGFWRERIFIDNKKRVIFEIRTPYSLIHGGINIFFWEGDYLANED